MAKPIKIKIKGKGLLTICVEGAIRRLEMGKAITVTKAEKAFLDYSGVAYSKA
jgi:hypothetical protein